MTQAEQVDVAKELASAKSTLRALLSGRDDALDRWAWSAAIETVHALCSVSPAHFHQLMQQTTKILRHHLNSVRHYILDVVAEAPDHITAAPGHATVALENLTLASSISYTQPNANREARKRLLQRYAKEWAKFSKSLKKIGHIYVHFNMLLEKLRKEQNQKNKQCKCKESKKYTASSVTYDSWPIDLKEIALQLWLEYVMVPAGETLRGAITAALRGECEGRPYVERVALKVIIDSFRDVREYDTIDKGALHREWVVLPYLAAVRVQHAERAQALLAEVDVAHFMRHMLAVHLHELVTLLPYCGAAVCRDAQINFLEAAMVPHVGKLKAAAPALMSAAAGAASPTARHELRDLHLLVRLLHELKLQEPLQALADAAHAHIVAEGRAMLQKRRDGPEMHMHFVHTILRLRIKTGKLFVEVFEGDQLFCVDILDKAWRAVLNGGIPGPTANSGCGGDRMWCAAELLARYYDALLRWSSDADMETRLATTAPIFRYLDDKDLFQERYQRLLAKRLLNRSSSMKLEEALINKFRLAGTEFNGKLHAMYKDIAASFALNEEFRQWTEKKREPFLWGSDEDCGENTAQVLQGWAWPLAHAPTQWVAPAPLESYTRKFEAFYKQRHRHRRLAWLHELSTGELVLRYTARRHELTATGAQCGLLLAFQERERWGAEELRERLRLQRNDWVRQLQPLLKLRLLLADGDVEGGDTPDGDARATLTLNLDFSHKRLKIKITCSKASAKQTAPRPAAQAQAQVPSRRDLRCKTYTQALLMRIMKKRKVLHRDALLQETRAQSEGWFSPAPELLQTYIDELVFKEYLEPVPGDSHTYKYLP